MIVPRGERQIGLKPPRLLFRHRNRVLLPFCEIANKKHTSGTAGVITLVNKGDGHAWENATAQSVELGDVVSRLVGHLDCRMTCRFT